MKRPYHYLEIREQGQVLKRVATSFFARHKDGLKLEAELTNPDQVVYYSQSSEKEKIFSNMNKATA